MLSPWSKKLAELLAAEYQAKDSSTDEMRNKAAVLALITSGPVPALIFTRRTRHLNQHAGEVCFPGGKYEEGDQNLCETALRETYEEIGLSSQRIIPLGALKPRITRSGMMVHPYVGLAPQGFQPSINYHEIDLLFEVPLSAFSAGIQVRTDVFEHHGQKFRIPVYAYNNQTIWGFTAGVTRDLLTIIAKIEEKPIR